MLTFEQAPPLPDFDRQVFEIVIPNDHYLRQVAAQIDFERFRPRLAEAYSVGLGRPAIDPVRMRTQPFALSRVFGEQVDGVGKQALRRRVTRFEEEKADSDLLLLGQVRAVDPGARDESDEVVGARPAAFVELRHEVAPHFSGRTPCSSRCLIVVG